MNSAVVSSAWTLSHAIVSTPVLFSTAAARLLQDGTLFILDVLWVCRVVWEREVEWLERVLIDVGLRDEFRS